jgi:hypothetical protein
MVEPHTALEWISKLSHDCIAMFISTPDRDKRRGVSDMGPPANPCHVREWNYGEFEKLLAEYHFCNVRMDYTIDNNLDRNRVVRKPQFPNNSRASLKTPLYKALEIR